MIDLFVYTISAFGLAYIVGHSKISLPFRERLGRNEFGDDPPWWTVIRLFALTLLECPACFGTWEGFGWGLVTHQNPIKLALFTCGSNLLLAKFAGLMEDEHEDTQ